MSDFIIGVKSDLFLRKHLNLKTSSFPVFKDSSQLIYLNDYLLMTSHNLVEFCPMWFIFLPLVAPPKRSLVSILSMMVAVCKRANCIVNVSVNISNKFKIKFMIFVRL